MTLLEILYKCVEKYSGLEFTEEQTIKQKISSGRRGIKYISGHINVNVGTIKRWMELQSVPDYYRIDLSNLLGIDVDYSMLTAKDKNQFYTSKHTAKHCYEVFNDLIKSYGDNPDEYLFVEPSVGNGNFYQYFPEDRRIGIDIETDMKGAIISDYLNWQPESDKKYLVLGNPPFGLRSNLALRFLNHSNYADYVGFILPQIFDSEGKGSTKNRVLGLNLIYSAPIKPDFYYPDGTEVKVNCIFQIWAKNHSIEEEKNSCKSFMRVYSLSDGGTIDSTRNKDMIGKCDVYLPQTCYGEDKMKIYYDFELVPKRTGYGIIFHSNKEKFMQIFLDTKWSEVAFKSTNGALNLRTAIINDVIIKAGYKD